MISPYQYDHLYMCVYYNLIIQYIHAMLMPCFLATINYVYLWFFCHCIMYYIMQPMVFFYSSSSLVYLSLSSSLLFFICCSVFLSLAWHFFVCLGASVCFSISFFFSGCMCLCHCIVYMDYNNKFCNVMVMVVFCLLCTCPHIITRDQQDDTKHSIYDYDDDWAWCALYQTPCLFLCLVFSSGSFILNIYYKILCYVLLNKNFIIQFLCEMLLE